MAAQYNKTSRYTNTPVVDFYLDLWKSTPVKPDLEDKILELTPRYHERPDLLAYDLYGTPQYWWVFARRNMNTLVDPIRDFKSGLVIYAPAPSVVEKLA